VKATYSIALSVILITTGLLTQALAESIAAAAAAALMSDHSRLLS
jgi:hypothetical protein